MKIKKWEVVKGQLPFLCPFVSKARPPIAALKLHRYTQFELSTYRKALFYA